MLHFFSHDTAKVLLLLQQVRALEARPFVKFSLLQRSHLNTFLRHSEKFSPFWAQRLSEAGFDCHHPERCLLSDIAQLLRIDLKTSFRSLRARWPGLQDADVVMIASSGSTGVPVQVEKASYFYKPLEDAYGLLDMVWHQRDLNGVFAEIGFFTEDKSLPSWGGIYQELGHRGRYEKRAIGNRSVAEHLQWLQSVRPKYLMCSPFLAAQMAKLVLAEGIEFSFDQLISKSERVSPEHRRLVHEAFGAKIVDRYSSEENGMIALQCPKHDHLHVLPSVIVEIVDEAGQPSAVGVPGRVLVTSLYSYAMPLIRYDLGDIAEWGPPCDCGITWPVIAKLWGRVRHQVKLPDGSAFPMGFLGDDLGRIPAIREFRVKQYVSKELELQLVTDAPLTDANVSVILEALRKSGMAGLMLFIRFVTEIDWVPGRKREEFVQVDATLPDYTGAEIIRLQV